MQDAKALGIPLACSDIPVHREQAPAAEFFTFEERSVAAALARLWERDPRPLDADALALDAERQFARGHGLSRSSACATKHENWRDDGPAQSAWPGASSVAPAAYPAPSVSA